VYVYFRQKWSAVLKKCGAFAKRVVATEASSQSSSKLAAEVDRVIMKSPCRLWRRHPNVDSVGVVCCFGGVVVLLQIEGRDGRIAASHHLLLRGSILLYVWLRQAVAGGGNVLSLLAGLAGHERLALRHLLQGKPA
jgi:hypothetical protein